jgi:hypothetical protein
MSLPSPHVINHEPGTGAGYPERLKGFVESFDMPVAGASGKYRLFYASNPSSALCAALCAAVEPKDDATDVLLLQSDFYTGDNLQEYEIVMQALASVHDWDAVGFCKEISRALEYTGRRAPF